MEKLKTSGYAPVNGLQMYYEIHGGGEVPLVLIHGGGSTIKTTFSRMIPLLPGKLIAVELEAHGHTAARNAPLSFEQDADDVAALLKYLGVEKANFFGFSNGATCTLQIGIRHPEMVNKIIALAGADKRDAFMTGFFDGFENAYIGMMPAILKDEFLKVTPDENRMMTMFEKDVERMKNFRDIPDEKVKSIKVPVLVMAGDQDVITVEASLKLSKLVPTSRFAVLPGPHGACIASLETDDLYQLKNDSKQPQITAALIEEFLNS
jgi:pimeloyl-ACP methyl ester carboxylesterase